MLVALQHMLNATSATDSESLLRCSVLRVFPFHPGGPASDQTSAIYRGTGVQTHSSGLDELCAAVRRRVHGNRLQ